MKKIVKLLFVCAIALSLPAPWTAALAQKMEDECTYSENIEVEPLEKDQDYFNHVQILSHYDVIWDIWRPELEEYPLEVICE